MAALSFSIPHKAPRELEIKLRLIFVARRLVNRGGAAQSAAALSPVPWELCEELKNVLN